MKTTVGIDEVGRGTWAGDIVVCACCLKDNYSIPELTDSKKLSENKREQLFPIIQENTIEYAFGRCSPKEIDQLNILEATMVAMQRAVKGLSFIPNQILVDGNRAPVFEGVSDVQAIIKGDGSVACISAASILAKVTRDREMMELDKTYPHQFGKHKGYGTKLHMEMLEKHGVTEVHRKSFKPIARLLGSQSTTT